MTESYSEPRILREKNPKLFISSIYLSPKQKGLVCEPSISCRIQPSGNSASQGNHPTSAASRCQFVTLSQICALINIWYFLVYNFNCNVICCFSL